MLTQEEITKRKSHIGGSDIAVICGKSSYRTAEQLWREKCGLEESKDISHLEHIAFGNHMESIIRGWTEEKYGTSFHPVRLEYSEWPVAAANLDGLSIDNCVLEIKTVGIEKNIKASLGEVPEEYYYQLQWNMMVANSSTGLYVSYCKNSDETHYIEVLRDKPFQEEMLTKAKEFWHFVETNTPLTTISEEMKSLLMAARDAKAAADQAAARYEALQEEIKNKMTDDIEFEGMKVTRYERKGNVDYKKIPELQGVDLEPYRGKTTMAVRFSL